MRLESARLSFKSSASHSAKYRPDVDGLRAIAVLGVLFFHTGFSVFQGGFAGVDIFFVISGYLITSLLVRDILGDKFSIASFYERRMRRIFPALFVVLFFCIAASFILFNPLEMSAFGEMLIATTFFASNFYFWQTAHPLGYFDTAVNSKPLLHTWSLAVEEQFYVIFPLLLFLLFRWARTRVRIWLVLITAGSFVLNLWATQHKNVLAFYWLPPRAWELSIGALLALKILPSPVSRVQREVACGLGLIAVVGSLFLPLYQWGFPGYSVLLPCAGTWLVIYAGEAGPSIAKTQLSFPPLVFIGTISYSLYLWHWPIIVFSRHLPFHFTPGKDSAVVLVASILFAFLSFEYIERPFRGTSSPYSRRQIFVLGAVASVVTAVFGSIACLSHGLLNRYGPPTRNLVVTNMTKMSEFDESCGNFKTQIRSSSDVMFCTLGAVAPHKIMFWGDSHVQQMDPVIRRLYAENGLSDHGVVLAISNGCLPDPGLNNTGDGFYCDTFSRFSLARADQQDIDTVFLGFSTWWSFGYNKYFCRSSEGKCRSTLLSDDAVWRDFVVDLAQEIRHFKGEGKHVIVSLPFPEYDKSIPEIEINDAVFGRFGFSVTPKDVSSPFWREQVRETATNAGAEIFDPRESLCQGEHCVFEVNGVSLYKDRNHLTTSGSQILTTNLQQVLDRNADASHVQPKTGARRDGS